MAQAAEAAGVKAYSWEKFLELGRASPAAAVPPKPEDLCTIMYTSGTTGDPKVTHLISAPNNGAGDTPAVDKHISNELSRSVSKRLTHGVHAGGDDITLGSCV